MYMIQLQHKVTEPPWGRRGQLTASPQKKIVIGKNITENNLQQIGKRALH